MARKRQPGASAVSIAPSATKPERNKPDGRSDDPLAILRYEHRMLDSLFSQFALRKERRLAERLCGCLASHQALEEGFYREAETIPELHVRVEVAVHEHRGIEQLMRAVGSLDEGETLNQHMLALQREVEQHMRNEERVLFPVVVKGLGRDRLRALGISLRGTKDKLLLDPAARPGPSRSVDEPSDEDRTVAS